MKIPFNKPYITPRETDYIRQAMESGHLSGNGPFTERCSQVFEKKWRLGKCFLTTSCTDALEMASMLINIQKGDEVIVPAYTFVSTALAFARQGAKIVFCDSRENDPCLDEDSLEHLITKRTKAIVPVHYGGKVCNMDRINDIALRHKLWVVEDAAHAFGSSYNGRPAGTLGHLGCFSFHETKVIHCGEGGMLSVNDIEFAKRAEIIWEKGTNRCEFHRGEVPAYEWKDTGSSFLMSDINAAILLGQLEDAEKILRRRRMLWEFYYNSLDDLYKNGFIKLPVIPGREDYNYYSFYVLTLDLKERDRLKNHLNHSGIQAVTHYLDLSNSTYIKNTQGKGQILKNCTKYQDTLLRLPLYNELRESQIINIVKKIRTFYE